MKSPIMDERRSQPSLPRPKILRRMLGHGLAALSLLLVSLALGVVG
jgi:hypothetical protein